MCSIFRYILWIVTYVAIAVFIVTNLTCAILNKRHEEAIGEELHYFSVIRVVINDSLFIIAAIALSVCLFYMTKVSSTSVVLEARVRISPNATSTDTMVCLRRTVVLISPTLMVHFREQQFDRH